MEPTARTLGNLSPTCGARRLRFGVISLAVALVLAVVLIELGVPWAFRLLLLAPFYVASTGVLQGLYGT
jgi:formate-dependent nitrite reductase membrane component NrfD